MSDCQPNKEQRKEHLRQREEQRWEKEGDAQKWHIPHGCGLHERQRVGKRDRGQITEPAFCFLMGSGSF